jgi:hypothetical protein
MTQVIIIRGYFHLLNGTWCCTCVWLPNRQRQFVIVQDQHENHDGLMLTIPLGASYSIKICYCHGSWTFVVSIAGSLVITVYFLTDVVEKDFYYYRKTLRQLMAHIQAVHNVEIRDITVEVSPGQKLARPHLCGGAQLSSQLCDRCR